MKMGESRWLKAPVADVTPDGTLSSPCSLRCKHTDRLPAALPGAFSCSLPAPPAPPHPVFPRWAPSHRWVWSQVSLSGLPTGQQRPLWPHCVPAPCLVPSSPVAQSLSAHLLVVCTRPSGGTAPVWPMAVDHGAGTEQALSKRVRASRGCLGGK